MTRRFFRGVLKTFSALFTNTAIVLLFVGAVIPKEVLILEFWTAIMCIVASIMIEAFLEKQ